MPQVSKSPEKSTYLSKTRPLLGPQKQNFGPRKKRITVARLKEEHGKPLYHLKFDEEVSETVGVGKHKKLVKICFDEDIAFKIDDYLVIYHFARGKFLARVIKGASPNAELPELLPH